MCVVFDLDNADSDDPANWVYPDAIASRLKELGISFWIAASRNHMLPKNGKAPRPKIHTYLPLSTPLYDGDKFVCYCEWCIKTFDADPQVKSKAQKIFGFGNNSHAFVESWSEGKCLDEIVSDDDLVPFLKPAKQSKQSTLHQPTAPQKSQPQNTTTNRSGGYFTIDQIKTAAHGRELDILEHVAGISADLLDGKHHACPACAGKDRFRLINAEKGAVLCNQCFNKNCGDFIAAVQHYCNVSFSEALGLIGEFLNLEPVKAKSAKSGKDDRSPEQKQEEWDKMFGSALTASEIWTMDFGLLKWFVENLIPEGLTVLAGQSKIGKSWFMLQLAICIATRWIFLNAFDTDEHEVLYIALEDNPRRMQSRLKLLGLPVNDKLRIIHTWSDQWEALDYYLKKNPTVKVVIIDTWGRFVAGVCKDGNDYTETTALAALLHDLAKKHKAAIIAVTHTKKGTSAKDWIEDTIPFSVENSFCF